MSFYISFVTEYPLASAIIQFAILGTLGEFAAKWMVAKKLYNPFPLKLILWKGVVWGILAISIKYAFIGFEGFVTYLSEMGYLPQTNTFTKALFKSAAMNLQFGLFLVIFHRILDNLVVKEKNWDNLDKGMMTLLWFWIPAHTITFMLPREFQIGLAAVWSVALGIILGFYNRKK